jgi:hypothetical protein
MTDIADLRRKALAARELTVEVGQARFTLRLPTQHEVELESLRTRVHEPDSSAARNSLLTRRLLQRAVVGWSGVTTAQLAPDAGHEPADHAPELVELLLDHDLDTAQRLLDAFIEAFNRRREAREAAAKN